MLAPRPRPLRPWPSSLTRERPSNVLGGGGGGLISDIFNLKEIVSCVFFFFFPQLLKKSKKPSDRFYCIVFTNQCVANQNKLFKYSFIIWLRCH